MEIFGQDLLNLFTSWSQRTNRYTVCMKVLLTRLSSNHEKLRTSEIQGWTNDVPREGHPFQMTAPPLEVGSHRLVWTTPVTEVTKVGESSFLFKTANSSYKLDLLTDHEFLREV